MGFLSNLAGSIFGNALGNAVNSAFDLNSYEKKAEIDYNYTKKLWDYQMQNKHQLEVGDLESAGLNKILSATNGQAVSATPIGGSSSNNQSNLGSTAMQLAVDQQRAEIEKTEAETNRYNAETERIRSDTDKFRAGNESERIKVQNLLDFAGIDLSRAMTGKTVAEAEKVYQDIANSIEITEATVRQLDSGTALNYKQIDKLGEEMKYLMALKTEHGMSAQKIAFETEKLKRDLADKKPQLQREVLEGFVGRNLYKLSVYGNLLRETIPFDVRGLFGSVKR